MTTSDAAHDRLFSSLSPTVRAFASRGVPRSYPRNTVIVHEGEMGDTTFVLLQGCVKVYSTDVDGREITYDIVHAGDYFAEMWLDGGPRSASVITLEPCLCAVVSRAEMIQHLEQSPEFTRHLLARMIGRVRAATAKARQLALNNVYERVVSVLEGGHGPAGSGAPIVLSALTHQAIASRVGSSREMVSRILKELERGGYVELGLRRIVLKRKLPARW
ncbi:Crp/Fnr family transcriptional regulator [Ramlibacter henchirensis]|uniref:Crp/Fnr family transcriptional regulator n=1 Tax=Ramlibacter henchirensis TaxID=204072 RepID=A0A4Z0C5R4_9BURK|nr:Crp/Fnr family transcriptional regulator [Ramlibacter henchirensis]TFZ07107.1 Crp/Fnr family transcriptional regulator [Ramlibacter henchirensis]